MTGTKELKERIKSVSDTKKITDAMYMVSSNRLAAARKKIPAVQKQVRVLSEFLGTLGQSFSAEGPRAVLVLTADKGLAGDFSKDVCKEALRLFREDPRDRFFVSGTEGIDYLKRREMSFEPLPVDQSGAPVEADGEKLGGFLTDLLSRGFARITVVSYVMPGGVRPFLSVRDIWPTAVEDTPAEVEFIPGKEQVLNRLLPVCFQALGMQILLENHGAEQYFRMLSMEAAGDNAEKMLEQLNLEMNRVRQDRITREIIELTAEGSRHRDGK